MPLFSYFTVKWQHMKTLRTKTGLLSTMENQSSLLKMLNIWRDKEPKVPATYVFTQCIISLWNSMPQDAVMAHESLAAFHRRLDRLLEEKAITGYRL